MFDDTAPDVVVNAAAYTNVDKAESEPDQAYLVNATGPLNLAQECERRSATLIHLSTDYVFDGGKRGYYTEEDPVAPLGVYGLSKLDGERNVATTCPQHVILRTAWVYSPYGHNFVKTMLRLAESRSELSVVGDQHGSPTYAPHLADAIVSIAEHINTSGRENPAWGIYHAAGAGETTWCEFAREVFNQSIERGGPSSAVKPITTDEYPTPAARPSNSRLDTAKLRRDYGVSLPHWKVGVASCVSDLLKARMSP